MPDLPKLPRGQGSFTYIEAKGLIQYRKKVNDKVISVYGKTVKECTSKMKKREYEELTKISYEHPSDFSNEVIFQDSIKHWIETYKRPILKPRSYDTIESTYLHHIHDKPLGRTSLQNIRAIDIQNMLNMLIKEKSLSTVKKLYNLLNQFFAFYYAQDLNNNPMNLVKMPRKEIVIDSDKPITDENELVVLNDSEIEQLTNELNKPYSNGRMGYSYGHMLLFIMWTFMRVGEVIALQYKDIDFEEKAIRVFKGYNRIKVRNKETETHYEWVLSTTKTKKGRRTVYLSEKALLNLQLHLSEHYPHAEPETFIFFSKQGNPMADQFLNDMLAKALKRAGIQKHVTVHGLRHTGISYYLRHGAPIEVISEMAGHNDISVTNNVYYDVVDDQIKNAFKKFMN